MNKKEKRAIRRQAFLLGVIAFGDGKYAIPALDKNLMELLDSMRGSELGASIPVLKSWIAGYNSANILVD